MKIARTRLLAMQLFLVVVIFVVWHVATTTPQLFNVKNAQFFFSTPSDIAARVVKMFVDGGIWRHLGVTLIEAALAFVIGAGLGLAFGFWFARKPFLAAIADPFLKAMNSLPRVVLAPIFALWFGNGIASKVALGVTLVFFIVFFNVFQGVREVNQNILSNARMLGMNERQLMRHVYWPAALAWVFSSLHTSVGFAVVGAVVGEYLGSSAGLGYLIHESEGVFDTTGVFAGMFILMVFVIAVDILVTLLEKHLLNWQPDHSTSVAKA